MTNNVINVNLRKRLLCCSSLEDFMLENLSLVSLVKIDEIAVHADLCRQLTLMIVAVGSVREKIQIFTLCRERGCPTSSMDSEQLKGVVIEFGTESGVDALAVYSDKKGAWYIGKDNYLIECDFSGKSQSAYQRLLDAVARGERHPASHPTEVPSPPPPGYILISFLSTSGIAYGVGASRDLASDRFGGPIIHAALDLRKIILGID